MNPKSFLTKSGNILVACTNGKYCFLNPSLEFIREVSESEGEYLSDMCLEINFNVQLHSQVTKYLLGLEFPTWHFVKSILVLQDNSNYKWETSNNGGNYAFQTYHDWYVAQYPDGKWKFAFIENHSTSAEFSYDELAGSFQNDLGTLYLSNAVNAPHYSSQAGIEWSGNEKSYTSSEVLEKIGTIADLSDLWGEIYEYIPSRWDEEEEGYTINGLSFSDKKDIVIRLKELYENAYSEQLKNDEVLKFEELHLHFKRSKSSRRGGKRGERR